MHVAPRVRSLDRSGWRRRHDPGLGGPQHGDRPARNPPLDDHAPLARIAGPVFRDEVDLPLRLHVVVVHVHHAHVSVVPVHAAKEEPGRQAGPRAPPQNAAAMPGRWTRT